MKLLIALFIRMKKIYVISSKSPDIAFYEIWTQKEAYMKYKGVGLNDDLTLVNTKHPNYFHISLPGKMVTIYAQFFPMTFPLLI